MKLIPKDALVAEIESKIEKYTKRGEESDAKRDGYGMYWGGVVSCLNEIRTLCDTLKVKEVDLDSERRKYLTEHFNVYEDGILQSKRSNLPLDTYDVIKIAKHFFELGLKAQKEE